MAVISGGSFAKDLLPFIGKWFGDEYKDFEPLYVGMMDVEKAKSRFVDEPLVAGFGLPVQKDEGSAVSYDAAKQGYNKRYTMIGYALGFIITRDMLDDGLALVNGERFARHLKRSMMKGREVVAANVYNNAFDTASFADGGDGKALLTTDHPTQSADLRNELATAADLSEAALEQVYVDIINMKDDRGLRIHIRPRKLIIPPDLKFEADRLLKSALRPATADNDINVVKDMGLIPEGSMVNPYLSDTDAWFVRTDAPDGVKMKMRRDIDLSTENDFDTENAKFKSVMRFDVGWTDPRGLFGSPGA